MCRFQRAKLQRYRESSVSFGIFCFQLSASIPTDNDSLGQPRLSRFHFRRLESTALPLSPNSSKPSLSPTLRVPEAASKELSYPRAAHTDFPPSSPFPSTTVTPSSSTSISASSPPPELTPSLVVTPPTRAPVYLSGHMVGEMTRCIQRYCHLIMKISANISLTSEKVRVGQKYYKNCFARET